MGEPAGLVDLLPTVCGLLGIEKPAGVHLDGSDLSALLKGGDGFVRHQPLFWHLQKSRPMVAMRDGDFSLVADPDYELSTNNMFREEWIPKLKSGGYRNFQLFNLKEDPNQEKNLAATMPEKVVALKEKLLAINASVMADGADWHLEGQEQAAPNSLTAEEKAAGWELLFDGKKIEGWRGYGSPVLQENGWEVEDGTLHKPAGKPAGDMMTVGVFDDFEFTWEWRLEKGGNNGVKYFITPERGAAVGHEYQMIDDAVVEDAYTSTASFYLVVKPTEERSPKPPGEWNHSRIVVKGNHVEHWLNGKNVVRYECGSPEVMGRVLGTKFKKYPGFGEKVVGHLLLTDHRDPCWYRNLKVRRF